LSEVARGREMVMQATVGHKKHLAARDLAVDDAAHIKACLAHEVAAELDHEPRLRQRGARPLDDGTQVLADRRKIELHVAREIRNAEATADVHHADRGRRGCRETNRKLNCRLLRFANSDLLAVLLSADVIESL